MVTEPTPRPRDVSGALGIVLGGAAVHFVVARLLLAAQGGVARVGDAGRDAVDLSVIVTAVVMLVLLWSRARAGDTARLTGELPPLLALAPVAIAAATLRFAAEGGLGPAATFVPLASTAAASLLSAVVMALALRAMLVRGGFGAPEYVTAATLSGALGRAITAACVAVVLVAAANVTDDRPWWREAPGLWSMAATTMLVALAVVAGVLAGRGIGTDTESIARRLDALGHDATPSVLPPIVPTDLDQTAELLGELERLRARLDHDQRQYQDALERTQAADAAKAEFLTAVSHELRTPLHTVGGYAQVLLSGIAAPLSDAQAEDVRLIQAGGRQLLELVNDILDLSMIESGELRLSFAPTDVGALVDEVVRFHQPLVRDRDVTLRADLAELPDVVCDRRRIAQILTNLISNAVKFTEHGSIVVSVDAVDAHNIAVMCTDTGIGIAEAELPLIFEEYQQAGTISRRKKGTGLGLAIARSIAIAHGGSLRAESVLGRGSTFTLVLPIDPPRRPVAIDIAEEAARAVVRARHRGETLDGMTP